MTLLAGSRRGKRTLDQLCHDADVDGNCHKVVRLPGLGGGNRVSGTGEGGPCGEATLLGKHSDSAVVLSKRNEHTSWQVDAHTSEKVIRYVINDEPYGRVDVVIPVGPHERFFEIAPAPDEWRVEDAVEGVFVAGVSWSDNLVGAIGHQLVLGIDEIAASRTERKHARVQRRDDHVESADR